MTQAGRTGFRLLTREEFTELSTIHKCDYIASVIGEPPSKGLQLFRTPSTANAAMQGSNAGFQGAQHEESVQSISVQVQH